MRMMSTHTKNNVYHILNPLVSLTLRVNKQRPAPGQANDDPIFCWVTVCWQAEDLPASEFHRITHGVQEVRVWGGWDVVAREIATPVANHPCSIVSLQIMQLNQDLKILYCKCYWEKCIIKGRKDIWTLSIWSYFSFQHSLNTTVVLFTFSQVILRLPGFPYIDFHVCFISMFILFNLFK